jgi:hypothetical protein
VGDDELVRVQRHALLGMAAVQQLAQRLVAAHQRAGDLRRFELAHGPRAGAGQGLEGEQLGRREGRAQGHDGGVLHAAQQLEDQLADADLLRPGARPGHGGGSGREAWRVRT